MTNSTAQELIDALDATLEGERTAVLKGDLQRMSEFVTEKEAIISALSKLDAADVASFEYIQGKLDRNQALLDGALHGIRRAAAQLAAMRKVRRSLETYGEDGQKKTLGAFEPRKLEKRA